ncbi:phage minor head protein [Actinoallomurus sp. CA-142502]|uniref:phage minor head protein n=1 Tax=Actinoallomurus sp. CA-142502 TaxID=3239885 RepID=UPI003D8B56D2
MAIRRDTLALARELRRAVLDVADEQTRRLVQAWARAWDTIVDELTAALDELVRLAGDDRPTRAQLARAARLHRALVLAQTQLEQLALQGGADLREAVAGVVSRTATDTAKIIASQLPAAAGDKATLATSLDRAQAATLHAIVVRTSEQITSLLRPLSADATEAMKRELVRGVAVGDNPRETARRILQRLEGAFNGGLQRALVIARTEILDAHRAAATAQQAANSKLLAGWIWHAELTRRTCPSCWAKNGTLHPLDEPGPLDHQQGRCSRMPKTKSWTDLGFDIPEPPDLLPDARQVFAALPRADQVHIMGAARLDALQRGQIAWADLPQRRTTAGWRDSWAPAPLRDLLQNRPAERE